VISGKDNTNTKIKLCTFNKLRTA